MPEVKFEIDEKGKGAFFLKKMVNEQEK